MTPDPATNNHTDTDTDADADADAASTPDTHLSPQGLWIPPSLREFTGQIVFRTPRATIQHFGSHPLDPYYGTIDESHFGDPDTFRDARNPRLAPDRVSIKPQGDEAVVLTVTNTDGDTPDDTDPTATPDADADIESTARTGNPPTTEEDAPD